MKASSSDASKDGDADNDEDLTFDYCDFFSVLMYYAHMSKDEIMRHSRAFLHGIYRTYVKRACENLGVSSDREEDDDIDEENAQASKYGLTAADYPESFSKLPPRNNGSVVVGDASKTRDFLSGFGDAAVIFKDAQIATE